MKNFTIESLKQEKEDLGLPYLILQVNSETQVALAMEDTQEVLTIPVNRITAIPNMSKEIVGLINQRNRVFWVADLALMLDLPLIRLEKQQYSIVIIKRGQNTLGLIVQEIKGVTRISKNIIQSPIGEVQSSLIPYLQGCLIYPKEKILILDAHSLINSPILQNF